MQGWSGYDDIVASEAGTVRGLSNRVVYSVIGVMLLSFWLMIGMVIFG